MSTKLSVEAANELFQKIGVQVVVVAEGETPDASPDLENISKGVFMDIEEKMRHDIELDIKDSARKEEAGKHLGSLRSLVKREFGIDDKEMKELSQADIIKLAKGKFVANKSDADNDLAKRLEDAQREKAELQEEFETKLSAKDAEWLEKFQDKDIDERFIKLVNEIPRVGGDPIKQARAIKSAVKQDYIVKLNANKEVELYDKANPEKKIFDGKNLVTDKYFAEKYLKEMGMHAPDASHIVPKDVIEGKETKMGSGVHQLAPTDAMDFLMEDAKKA